MRNDFVLQLEPSKISGITLETVSALKIDPNMSGGQQAKAIVNTTEQWQQKRKYVPARGEIIVYSDRTVIDGVNYPGIKIGDGMAYVADLPFVGQEIEDQIMIILNNHIGNHNIHVTPEDKEFWNNKLNYSIDGEKLVLNRN